MGSAARIPFRKQSTLFHPLNFIHCEEVSRNRDKLLLHLLVLNNTAAAIQFFHYSGDWLRQVRNYKESKAMRHLPHPLPIIPLIWDEHIWLWLQDTSVPALPNNLQWPQVICKSKSLSRKKKNWSKKAFSFLTCQLTSPKYFMPGILWGLKFYDKLKFIHKWCKLMA